MIFFRLSATARLMYSRMGTLFSGTLAAQVIGLASYPFVARIFGPEIFGSYGLILVFSTFISTIITWRYEQCIVQIDNEDESYVLYWLLLATFIISIFIFIAMSVPLLLIFPTVYGLSTATLFFMSLLLGALINISTFLIFISVRFGDFDGLSTQKVVRSLLLAIVQIALGLLWAPALLSLVLANFFASVSAILFLLYSTRTTVLRWLGSFGTENSSIQSLTSLARRFRSFPKFNLPYAVQHNGSSLLMISIVSSYYSITDAGLYFMMRRICHLPSDLISTSISLAFFKAGVDEKRLTGSFKNAFIDSSVPALFLGVGAGVIFFVFGEVMFRYALGNEWARAGALASIYAPFVTLHLVISAMNHTNIIAGKQKSMLIVGSFQTLIFVCSFWLEASYNGSLVHALQNAVLITSPYLVAVFLWYRHQANRVDF